MAKARISELDRSCLVGTQLIQRGLTRNVAKMSQLNSDGLRVQVLLLRWFEINVDARSGKEALVVAENLPRAHSKRAADG